MQFISRPFTTPRALLHLKDNKDDDDEDKVSLRVY
jgi:hypothetical protein